jgi:hypothetical protein
MPAGQASDKRATLERISRHAMATGAVMLGAIITLLVVVIHALVANPAHTSVPSSVGTAAPTPAAAGEVVRAVGQQAPVQVIRDYYEAISRHDWPLVWRLGGQNVGTGASATYDGMISSYKDTIRDTITEVHAAGNVVTGRFQAYETEGVVHTYQFKFIVRNGAIVSGTAEAA